MHALARDPFLLEVEHSVRLVQVAGECNLGRHSGFNPTFPAIGVS
jgi:hypothetical protein